MANALFELLSSLGTDIEISDNLINEWVDSGCLIASFEPPSGTPPTSSARKPPSQR